jgi:nucleoside-diphosphate-sugar epimerase
MQVIGSGFLATNLREQFGDRHPAVTAVAAGVSSTSVVDPAAFDREAELVYRTVRDCHRQGRLVVFFSTASSAMYGASPLPATEAGPVYPTSVYGRHKLALEAVLRGSAARWLVLRLSHVVGPHQRAHQLIPALVSQVLSGRVAVSRGAYRDLVDVADVTAALEGLLSRGVHDVVVNVASGIPQPIELVVSEVERLLGVVARREVRDGPQGRTVVSLDRLCDLVPEWPAPDDPASHLSALLGRYVPPPGPEVALAAAAVATADHLEGERR